MVKSNVCYSVDPHYLSKTIITLSQHSSAWLLKYPAFSESESVYTLLADPVRGASLVQKPISRPAKTDGTSHNLTHGLATSSTYLSLPASHNCLKARNAVSPQQRCHGPCSGHWCCEFTKQENIIWCVDEDRIINRQNDGSARGL